MFFWQYSTNSETTVQTMVKKGQRRNIPLINQVKTENNVTKMNWANTIVSGDTIGEWKSTRFLNVLEFILAFKDLKGKILDYKCFRI